MIKDNNFRSLEKLFASLLAHDSILMHFKICSKYPDFANNEILQYTLVPQLNTCSDFDFLKNTTLNVEASNCLSTLAKCFNSVFYPITANFVRFALLFQGYDCINAAFKYEDNYHAVGKGIVFSEISFDAADVMMENLVNFLWPSIFPFLQKMIP
jgi:hypothetical protein